MTTPPDERGLNGHVVLVLDERFRRPGTEDLYEVARRGDLPVLAELLDDLDRPPTAPLVTGARREQWERLEEPPGSVRDAPPSLLVFWRVDVRRTGRDPEVLARLIARLPGVRTAYAELLVHHDDCAPGDATARLAASHLDPDGVGIGLDEARRYRGGDGSGIACVDIEEGWRFDHPALAVTGPRLISLPPLAPLTTNDPVRHGTAVLGVVAGADRAAGLRPIAPGCDLMAASHHDAEAGTDMHVHLAIGDAITELTVGGARGAVIVLEVQRGSSGMKLPAEIDLATRSAVVTAIDKHAITVVAAAGNSTWDLDAWMGSDGFVLSHDTGDTGSVLVGACDPEGGRPDGHQRWLDSNYGSRVDCSAWGAGVRTTDVVGDRPDFGGTSAATAIVAGIAVVTQAMRLAATGSPFTPSELRAVLSAEANGTQQAGPAGKLWIGPMPDVGRIATTIGAVPL